MTVAELEAQLTAGYAEEAACYRAAAAELAQVADPAQGRVDDWLSQLHERLARVRAIERRLEPIKRAWLNTRVKPGSHLSIQLGDVAGAIRALQAKLSEMLGGLNSARDKLVPELDHAVQQQHGQRAYQAVITRSAW